MRYFIVYYTGATDSGKTFKGCTSWHNNYFIPQEIIDYLSKEENHNQIAISSSMDVTKGDLKAMREYQLKNKLKQL